MKTFCLHTMDEANGSHVEQLAAPHGVAVEVVFPRDRAPEAHGLPALIDLDFTAFTREERAAFVRKYAFPPPLQVLGVFSHHLTDDDVRTLRANGVHVFGRMDEAAMAAFVAALTAPAPPPAVAASPDTPEDGVTVAA